MSTDSSGNWLQVDRLFAAALDQPPERRQEWLESVCPGAPEVKSQVEELLALAQIDQDALQESGACTGPLWEAFAEEYDRRETTLHPGDGVGPYRIVHLIGCGGMGTVYRARHPALGRDVALKVLSDDLVLPTSRFERFEREARLWASLNHPNVAAVYDLLDIEGHRFLVLELVEGQTLAERLRSGPLNLRDTILIATQLANAISAAHRKGIVHRDIKPSNVKVTDDGIVKLLDFGLAKLRPQSDIPGAGDFSLTQEGVFVGTPGYMSPEQARCEDAEESSDVWAFGCLLYEMLSGRRAYDGRTVPELIAAVLRDEPDWGALPADTPPGLVNLVQRCLVKAPADRLKDIGEALIVLTRLDPHQSQKRGRLRRQLWWLLPVSAVTLAVALLAPQFNKGGLRTPRFTNPTQVTSLQGREDFPLWSPDGRSIVFAGIERSDWNIFVTQAGTGELLNRTADYPGTDLAPAWSPDGRYIAFLSAREGGGLYLMSPYSGAPRKLVSMNDTGFFFARPQWFPKGRELGYITSGAQGQPDQFDVYSLDTGQTRSYSLPGTANCRCDVSLSPDGRFLAYVDAQAHAAQVSRIWIYRFEDGQAYPLTDGIKSDWSLSWSPDGQSLLYVSNRGGSMDLWRQRIDTEGKPEGLPEALTVGIGMQRASLSPDGTRLAYSRGRRVGNLYRVPIPESGRVTWSDAEQLTFDEALVEFVDVSPDGSRLVVSTDRGGSPNLWTLPAAGGPLQRLTDDATPVWLPAWSPRDDQLAFYAYRSGSRDIWVMPAGGGAPRQLTDDDASDAGPSWSPDEEQVAFYSNRHGGSNIFVVTLKDLTVRPLTADDSGNRFPKFSPDGGSLAFVSGREGGALWLMNLITRNISRLTRGPANYASWSPDGNRLFFTRPRGGSDDIWAVRLQTPDEQPISDFSSRRGRLGREALATDGRFIYFTWEDDLGDIWVMDVDWK
jgi:Tol biopolymer transport system component